QVPGHLGADERQHLTERVHAMVLRRVADLAPAIMVPVLLATTGVAAGRLKVPVRKRTDPDVAPGRRDGQPADPPQGVAITDPVPRGVLVRKGFAPAQPADPGHGVVIE